MWRSLICATAHHFTSLEGELPPPHRKVGCPLVLAIAGKLSFVKIRPVVQKVNWKDGIQRASSISLFKARKNRLAMERQKVVIYNRLPATLYARWSVRMTESPNTRHNNTDQNRCSLSQRKAQVITRAEVVTVKCGFPHWYDERRPCSRLPGELCDRPWRLTLKFRYVFCVAMAANLQAVNVFATGLLLLWRQITQL
jgi:hypothetical protein